MTDALQVTNHVSQSLVHSGHTTPMYQFSDRTAGTQQKRSCCGQHEQSHLEECPGHGQRQTAGRCIDNSDSLLLMQQLCQLLCPFQTYATSTNPIYACTPLSWNIWFWSWVYWTVAQCNHVQVVHHAAMFLYSHHSLASGYRQTRHALACRPRCMMHRLFSHMVVHHA